MSYKSIVFFIVLFVFIIFLYFTWEKFKEASGLGVFFKFIAIVIGIIGIACPNLKNIVI